LAGVPPPAAKTAMIAVLIIAVKLSDYAEKKICTFIAISINGNSDKSANQILH